MFNSHRWRYAEDHMQYIGTDEQDKIDWSRMPRLLLIVAIITISIKSPVLTFKGFLLLRRQRKGANDA